MYGNSGCLVNSKLDCIQICRLWSDFNWVLIMLFCSFFCTGLLGNQLSVLAVLLSVIECACYVTDIGCNKIGRSLHWLTGAARIVHKFLTPNGQQDRSCLPSGHNSPMPISSGASLCIIRSPHDRRVLALPTCWASPSALHVEWPPFSTSHFSIPAALPTLLFKLYFDYHLFFCSAQGLWKQFKMYSSNPWGKLRYFTCITY